MSLCNRPLAAPGLISYRAKSPYGGYVMIGARDHADALREAQRSNPAISADALEVWNGARYVPAGAASETMTYALRRSDNKRLWFVDAMHPDGSRFPAKGPVRLDKAQHWLTVLSTGCLAPWKPLDGKEHKPAGAASERAAL